MTACTDAKMGNLGSVIPRCDSQNSSPVGTHWIRNSFDFKVLEKVKAWVGNFFGESTLRDYGKLSYGRHYAWDFGVSLCFDPEPESELGHNPKPLKFTTIRGEKVKVVFPKGQMSAHRGRITLDVPGRACDELTAPDLLLFMEGCQELDCTCTRLDVFWDDYNRTVSLEKLRLISDKGDFSMFQVASVNRTKNRTHKENEGLIYDAVTFGRRGCKGSGKYLRVYDKNLESKGESDCIRWECEFSQGKAQEVFTWLVGADGNLDVFATLCGSLIGGCINFIHRTGDKNIERLGVYEWWKEIINSLGVLSVRIAKKQNTLTGMIDWVERQVSPTLSVLAKAFQTERDFYNFMQRLREIGEEKVSVRQEQIAKQYAGCLIFDSKYERKKSYSEYLSAMCVQVS